MSTFDTNFSVAAGILSGAIALGALIRKNRTVAIWSFTAGMLSLALASIFDALLLRSKELGEAALWQRASLAALLPAPFAWLLFSLSYSRGNSREFLWRSRYLLGLVLVAPMGAALWGGLKGDLHRLAESNGWWLPFDGALGFLNLAALGSYVLILTNLERTLRAAVGTARWRIKFALLGIIIIFAARIYTGTQGLLFSGRSSALIVVEAIGLVLGCILLVVAYFRRAFVGLDVYPSRAFLQGSLTMLLVGGYLVTVGVLAQAAAYFGAAQTFRSQALIVFLAMAILAGLLLSDRIRERISQFVTRHFRRPAHDYRVVWTRLTQLLSGVFDQKDLCQRGAELVAETFEALSVSVWVSDGAKRALTLGASTRGATGDQSRQLAPLPSTSDLPSSRPFPLEIANHPWGRVLGELCPSQFPHGGDRLCLPLLAAGEVIGVMILADRINGRPYLPDEYDLLQCIGEQLAAAIQRIRTTAELMQSKELEAFQAMSAFFVHDLKNAASSLSLTLENFPAHIHEPAFRADALRVVGRTVQRINELIARLSTLRDRLEIIPSDVDLNELVAQVLRELPEADSIHLSQELAPLPKVRADREQLQSVISNLLLNARDAVQGAGHIRVETSSLDGCAVLSIADDGCGMPADFVQQSLFRPFHSTKKNGLGIGMFQSRQIVKAHCGSIEVETVLGQGTRFLIKLPVAGSPS